MSSNGIDHLNQETLQNILEGSVATSKRAINGQYTTPTELAKLLVRLTVKNWSDTILDCVVAQAQFRKKQFRLKKLR